MGLAAGIISSPQRDQKALLQENNTGLAVAK